MPTIRVIDDSAFSRALFRQLLAGTDYEVGEAADAEEALARLRADPPDCAVLDLLMPRTSGLELLARVKEEGLRVPIVVLTADIQKTTAERCADLGAVAVLNKPCRRERLLEALARALAR